MNLEDIMKRFLLLLTATLIFASAFLSACGGTENGNTVFTASEGAESKIYGERSETESKEESKTVSKEESEPAEELPEGAIEVLFTRYTESKPTFVIVGKCAQDAVVTAELDGENVTVESYMGWFSASFTKSGGLHKVTFTQTVDGEEFDIPRTYTVMPTASTKVSEQAVIACDTEFQFFLSKMIADFEGNNLYSDRAIIDMADRIEGRLETVRGYNSDAEIIYMIIPSPMTIYPELVPDIYTPAVKGNTRLDQVISGLETSGATVIDVRELFYEHKDDEMPLYYKLDSHWADYGAYLAYTELFNHISEKFPDAAPRAIEDFNWEAGYYMSADVIMYLDYPQAQVEEYGYYRQFNVDIPSEINTVPRYRLPQLLYSDPSTYEKVFSTNRDNLPSCIVYRDSYGAGIYDLIPERMDITHYIGMWNYTWNNRQIESEKPDYIIYLVAEWNLDEIVYK